MPKWKRGEVWYGYARAGEHRTPVRTTGCKDARAADLVLVEWERELADPAYAAAKRGTLSEAALGLIGEYRQLADCGKKSRATLTYYQEKLGVLLDVLGKDGKLVEIRAPLIDKYILARRKEEASEHTIGKELDVLKVLLRSAKRQGQWSGDLEAIFPRFSREYRPVTRTLTGAEVATLLRELPKDSAAKLAFAVATSAEANCIFEAQRMDISEKQDFVLLRGTKRELRARTVPIVAPWQRDLLAFAVEKGEGDHPYLFTRTKYALRNDMRRACIRLGLPHASPNDLRRTFAVKMRTGEVPLELIAPQMGHATTQMLQRVYGRLTPEQLGERVASALNAGSGSHKGATTQQDNSGLNGLAWTVAQSERSASEAEKKKAPGLHVRVSVAESFVLPLEYQFTA